MSKITVKTESLAARCEICHQSDLFDPGKNICLRCADVGIDVKAKAESQIAKPATERGISRNLIWQNISNRSLSKIFIIAGVVILLLGSLLTYLINFRSVSKTDQMAQTNNTSAELDSTFKQAQFFEQTGHYQEALDEYQKTIKKYPTFATAYFNSAVIYEKLDQIREAILAYNQAIKYNPDYQEAYQRLIVIYGKNRQTQQVADTYFLMGKREAQLEHYQKALELYNRVIALNFRYPDIYCQRAEIFNKLNLFEAAVADTRFCEKDSPKTITAKVKSR